MALPKKMETLLMKRLTLMDDAVDSIDVKDIELEVFKNIKRWLIKELDFDKDGNIKRTAKNLKTVQRVKLLRNIVVNDNYKAKIGEFIGKFNTVKDLSDDYIHTSVECLLVTPYES